MLSSSTDVKMCNWLSMLLIPMLHATLKTREDQMPKKEKKRLQVVISDTQDALLTRTAYELSSPERLISKSEVVRLAIEKIAREMQEGNSELKDLMTILDEDED